MDLLGRKKEGKNEPKENPILLKQLQDRVTEVFKIYDFYGMNHIQCEYVGHVFRMLGCVPFEADVTAFIGLCEHPTEKGKIRYADFFKTFFVWLLEERMKPANEHELLHALKLIDPGDGITEKRLREVALDGSESMSDEELKTMIAAAVDKKTDRVNYDSFAFKLFYNPKDSIYKLAKEVLKPIAQPQDKIETQQ